MPRPSTPEEAMRGYLSGEDPGLARFRRILRRVPHGPNCKLCAAPFEGPGGAVLRHVGFARFPGNPSICNACIKDLNKIGVFGAEIPVSLLFADIRGSTGIGERLSPTDFRAFLDRFYRLSSRAILDNDGIVDKFVGDEVDRAVLRRGLRQRPRGGGDQGGSGVAPCRRAPGREPGRPDPGRRRGPCGRAFVGSTAANDVVSDFTALGDVVNTTARLASEAAAGELLVSIEAASEGGLDATALEHRTLAVRGRSDAIEVVAVPELGH